MIGKWIKQYWWIVLILSLVVFIVIVSVVNNTTLNRVTTDILGYLDSLITPLGVILGLILGYPILRRKLLENHIIKQFEIIHENNRIVRKECLRLQEKYPVKYISSNLTIEYLEEALVDIKNLNDLCIEANQDAYRYSYWLYKSLQTFTEKVRGGIPYTAFSSYYCETISRFINFHLTRIDRYAQSMGFVPSAIIKKESILVNKLKRYVTKNHLFQVENNDNPNANPHTSASLVVFFSTTISSLGTTNGLLLKQCFEAAPSPSPFVRLLFNKGIYIPPILVAEEKEIFGIFKQNLILVSFHQIKSTKIEKIGTITTVEKSVSYTIHYANCSQDSFIEGTMSEKESLNNFNDGYLDVKTLSATDISEYSTEGEIIKITINEDTLKRHYRTVRKSLIAKMKEEMKNK